MDTLLREVGGREFHKGVKQSTKEQPLITIITSTFNAASDLLWTIDSIRSQTYPNIQWIIADGGSSDGTVDILKKNEDIIDYWFSEPDKGIYDAWNKALKYVKGEWVQFIGAADEYYDNRVLERVSSVLVCAFPQYEMVYGKVQIISEDRLPIEESGTPWKKMKGSWQGIRPMLPVHPEVFHHHSVFTKYGGFNTQYRIAADTDLMYRTMYKNDPLYIDFFIDKMVVGGVSTDPKGLVRSYKELKEINKNNNIRPSLRNEFITFIRVYVKTFLYHYMPLCVFDKIFSYYKKIKKKKM